MTVFARTAVLSLLVGAVLVLGGCAADDADQSPQDTTREQETTVAERDEAQRLPERVPPEALRSGAATGQVPPDVLEPVVLDAAERSGVVVTGIAVVTDQEMLWPDGSLGCAEPGELYTQAQVPGYWVVVQAGGVAYDYRLGAGGFFKLCESPLPAPSDTNPTS